jgi:hypothetical protein
MISEQIIGTFELMHEYGASISEGIFLSPVFLGLLGVLYLISCAPIISKIGGGKSMEALKLFGWNSIKVLLVVGVPKIHIVLSTIVTAFAMSFFYGKKDINNRIGFATARRVIETNPYIQSRELKDSIMFALTKKQQGGGDITSEEIVLITGIEIYKHVVKTKEEIAILSAEGKQEQATELAFSILPTANGYAKIVGKQVLSWANPFDALGQFLFWLLGWLSDIMALMLVQLFCFVSLVLLVLMPFAMMASMFEVLKSSYMNLIKVWLGFQVAFLVVLVLDFILEAQRMQDSLSSTFSNGDADNDLAGLTFFLMQIVSYAMSYQIGNTALAMQASALKDDFAKPLVGAAKATGKGMGVAKDSFLQEYKSPGGGSAQTKAKGINTNKG